MFSPKGLFLALLFVVNICIAQTPEFYKDVQPIIHANCVACHRPVKLLLFR